MILDGQAHPGTLEFRHNAFDGIHHLAFIWVVISRVDHHPENGGFETFCESQIGPKIIVTNATRTHLDTDT